SRTMFLFFFQAEDGIRDGHVTGVQTCALPIFIHERFCCNRGDGSQNLMWYSLFAPRSCKGRSIGLASAVATHLEAVGTVSRQTEIGRASCREREKIMDVVSIVKTTKTK